MKAHRIILATALVALAFNGVSAEGQTAAEKKTARIKKEAELAAQQAPAKTPAPAATPASKTPAADSNEKKIAEMQKSIEQLRADIENIKAARNELQVKLEKSDKDIAAQMMKIEDIKKKLTEKKQAAEALAKEKKQ
ncbi:MAG TPA: hypothetical protein VLB90_06965 [Pseudomonadales bacterium]|nr:hypothetical protein [Pseudomonadales bacterium]